MKYQVSLNGKQFEVEVEKGSVSAVPTGAAPASTPGCSSAGTRGSAGSGSSTRTRTRSSACRRRDRCSAHAGHHSGYPMHGRSGR